MRPESLHKCAHISAIQILSSRDKRVIDRYAGSVWPLLAFC